MKKLSTDLSKKLFDSISDGVLVVDTDYTVREANRTVNKMQQSKNKDTAIGKSIFKLFTENDGAKLKRNMVKANENDTACAGFRLLRTDDSEFPVEMKVTLLRDKYGGKNGFLVVLKDINEIKRVKESLRRHTRALASINTTFRSLFNSRDFDSMLERALESVLDSLNLSSGVLYLRDQNTKSPVLAAQKDVSAEFAKALNIISYNAAGNRERRSRIITVIDPHSYKKNGTEPTPELESGNIRCILKMYLKSKQGLVGLIFVASKTLISLGEEDIRLLETLGGQIGVAIENAQLLKKMNQLSISDELTGLYNRRHFYQVLSTELYRAQRYSRPISLAILDVDHLKDYNDRFGHIGGDNILKSIATSMNVYLRKTDASFRIGGDEFAIILPDTNDIKAQTIMNRVHSKWLQTQIAETQIPGIPLGFSCGVAEYPKNAETLDGFVFLADTALYYSKRKGRNRCTLVSELADISQSDKLSEGMIEQIYALSATVDAKETFGFGHFKRVATLAEMIGKFISLPDDQLADLRAASLLHDIGKIGISTAILVKSEKLNDQEWEILKKHSVEGAKIVSQIGKIAGLAPSIRYHHERYDGTGYPDGLNDNNIPLYARIICIADAYDSMTTPRPYKNAVSPTDAIAELKRCAGTQFDPELVKAAVEVFKSGKQSSDQ